MLARAEALYYEADFAKSIELLIQADEMLSKRAGSMKEKTDVKLQLALGFIGLNDNARAKTYLGELFVLDPNRVLDPQMFSPKVIKLAEEAKAEQSELRCRSVQQEAQKQLGAGNSDALVKLIVANRSNCTGLAALNPKAADMLFKEGLDAYKKPQMPEALGKFRAALAIDPGHELAAQYVDLTASKLEFTAERSLVNWRKNFNAGDFTLAARDYRELVSVSNTQTIDEVHSEYRRSLSSLVDAWNRACASSDAGKMEEIRIRVNALLPETSFAEDLLSGMKACTPTGCIQMESTLAMARLKERVEPKISSQLAAQVQVFPVTIRVKTRITDKGDVVSTELKGGNSLLYSAIQAAVDQWKFLPAVIEGIGPRCVETDIPIVIKTK
jgi:tetratricopeptide (TPR) repeat protein